MKSGEKLYYTERLFMPKFEVVSPELTQKMEYESATGTYLKVGFDNENVIRRNNNVARDRSSIWRQPFVHDIDKIMHSPYFNRYADKTQVYSLYKNDDLTRRSLHVQLVSRIARTIGCALHLNTDLIEAIALGHDMGHPPFAHTGEKYLNELFHQHSGKYFFAFNAPTTSISKMTDCSLSASLTRDISVP